MRMLWSTVEWGARFFGEEPQKKIPMQCVSARNNIAKNHSHKQKNRELRKGHCSKNWDKFPPANQEANKKQPTQNNKNQHQRLNAMRLAEVSFSRDSRILNPLQRRFKSRWHAKRCTNLLDFDGPKFTISSQRAPCCSLEIHRLR